ncbi:Sodium-dependent nutrient amino acid transporter 1 [Orchesella cincta]|uniref:Sodium-dependent nutrient amino acid transporter 1 n=1 Tax=Orchesella cincta TaxID=48709 RepID=A0A1D2MRT0_ORCCI|nr:Sodium-dependent nutrient amino acid transporter 1 [Orchesella cincta]
MGDRGGEEKVPDADQVSVLLPGTESESQVDRNSKNFDRSVTVMRSNLSTGPREKWGSKMQFMMSCIASAVGLGNVWRFPAVCARNGGAAFLVPYFIVLLVIARPLFVLELALGQFTSKGSVRCWDMSPVLTGIGVAGAVSSVLLSTFYIMLLAWALIYAVISFVSMCTGEVVWGAQPGPYFGGEVLRGISFDSPAAHDIHAWVPICHLVLALLVAWLLIWVTMVFGVEASGKVAYVTAMAPYVVLITLLIVGCCLPGAKVGIYYFVVPDLNKILIAEKSNHYKLYQFRFQAVGQCFFSLGIGFGGCIMFASFNEFNNNIIKDVMIIGLVDTFTSVLAGFSLLSILGFQATQTYEKKKALMSAPIPITTEYDKLVAMCKETRGTSEDDLKICQLEMLVNEGGAGVAFIQYPAAMYQVNEQWGKHLGGFLGLLFFLMLVLLAVGSANGFVGTTVTILADRFKDWKRSNIVSGVCMGSFFLGLIYTNGVGSEWFDVVDQHGVTAVVYVLSFLEVVAVLCCYGLKNFCDDLEFMRGGKKVGWYLRITWVTLPFLMVIIFITWLINYKPGKTWTGPIKAIAWTLTALCLSIIPGTAIYKYVQFIKDPWRRNVPLRPFAILQAIADPSPKWGPKERDIRTAWKEFKAERDPSYHICQRIFGICSRKSGEVRPDRRLSFATNAATTRPSESGGGLASGIGTPLAASAGSMAPPSQRGSQAPVVQERKSKT